MISEIYCYYYCSSYYWNSDYSDYFGFFFVTVTVAVSIVDVVVGGSVFDDAITEIYISCF